MPGWASLRRVGTSPQTSLVGEINDAVAQYFVTMSLRNVCVVFYPEQRTQYRSQFVSREGVTAVLHGFSEYDLGYQRLTTVRPEQARDRQQLARCTTKQLAIAVPMSSNNLYHQAFHAVPAWEALRAHASHNATLLPLVFPSAAFGRGKPASPRRWYVQPRASKVGRVWLACPPKTMAVACPTVASAPRQPLGNPWPHQRRRSHDHRLERPSWPCPHPGVGVHCAGLVKRYFERARCIDPGTPRLAMHMLRPCGGPRASFQPWRQRFCNTVARLPRSNPAEQSRREQLGGTSGARHSAIREPGWIKTCDRQRGGADEQATSRHVVGGAASGPRGPAFRSQAVIRFEPLREVPEPMCTSCASAPMSRV